MNQSVRPFLKYGLWRKPSLGRVPHRTAKSVLWRPIAHNQVPVPWLKAEKVLKNKVTTKPDAERFLEMSRWPRRVRSGKTRGGKSRATVSGKRASTLILFVLRSQVSKYSKPLHVRRILEPIFLFRIDFLYLTFFGREGTSECNGVRKRKREKVVTYRDI
jgi:hypothetical protein